MYIFSLHQERFEYDFSQMPRDLANYMHANQLKSNRDMIGQVTANNVVIDQLRDMIFV